MKIVFIALLTIFISFNSIGQDYSKLESIELKVASDYTDNESKVLECATFILSTTYDQNEEKVLYCTRFIMRWMVGCSYTFEFGQDLLSFPKKDQHLTSVYLASLSKAAISNNGKPTDSNSLNERGLEIFLDYCEDSSNKVKMNKNIKKALKSRSK